MDEPAAKRRFAETTDEDRQKLLADAHLKPVVEMIRLTNCYRNALGVTVVYIVDNGVYCNPDNGVY